MFRLESLKISFAKTKEILKILEGMKNLPFLSQDRNPDNPVRLNGQVILKCQLFINKHLYSLRRHMNVDL